MAILEVGNRPVVAGGGDIHGGEDREGVVHRFRQHVAPDPVDADHALCGPRETPLLGRLPRVIVRDWLVHVVVGLEEVPVVEDHPVLHERRAVQAQPPHQRRVGLEAAGLIPGDDGALVGPGARNDEVAGAHDLQRLQPHQGGLKVLGGLQDVPRAEHVADAAVLQRVLHGGLGRVEARVLLEAPAPEAHGRVDPDVAGPGNGGVERLPAADEGRIDGRIGEVEGAVAGFDLEAKVVHVAPVDHGAVGHGRE
mmetsp:Transcript_48694/g.130342  ORF Transcript_48694/g.130342 Transcript_48694/m.130342 type:complete len:252 (+) Transcript_48694:157-912(+)